MANSNRRHIFHNDNDDISLVQSEFCYFVKELEERANRQFRLDDQSAMDFPQAVADAGNRLQKFFNSKMVALRRLVTAAEQHASQVNIDAELPSSLPNTDCAQHLRLLNQSSVKNAAIWLKGANKDEEKAPKTGTHVILKISPNFPQ